MEAFFGNLVLGHLTADFLFQPKKMALEKSAPGWTGIWWCTLHCIVYAVCVCTFIAAWHPVVFSLVFASHWPVDRWSLAQKWLDLIGGRNVLVACASKEPQREIDIAFSCVVYTVADATIHILILWLFLPMIV